MKADRKLVLGLVALLILVAALLWSLVGDRGALRGAWPGDRTSAEDSAPPVEASETAPAPDLEPEPTERGAPGARTAAAREAGVEDQAITGVVRDAIDRGPLAGATVEAVHRLHEEYANLDLSVNRASRTVATATTGEDGSFRLEVTSDVPHEISVRLHPFANARRDFVFAGEHVELLLEGGALLEGRITRARDGSPVEGAGVRGWDHETRVERFRGVTDPGGFYRFEDVQPGVVRLAITPRELAAPGWDTVELAAGERVTRDFELEEGVKVHGRVTDAETGRPIAGAEIGEGWTYRKSVRSDADGEYALSGFGGPGVYDVHARATGYGEEQFEFDAEEMPAEDLRLDFELVSARSALGFVVDADGAPLEGVYCGAIASSLLDGMQYTDWESDHSDAEGRFEFASLDRRLGHQVLLRKEGYGTRVYDFPAGELLADVVELGTFTLGPAAKVRGMLVSQSGEPVPGHEVALAGMNEDARRLRPEGPFIENGFYTETRSSRADALGRFHFSDVAPGSYMVRARVPGVLEVHELAVEVREGQDVEGLQLVLPVAGTIRGRVLTPDGEPALEVIVTAHAPDSASPRLGRATSGAGGGFELFGVGDSEVELRTELWFFTGAPDATPAAPTLPVRVRGGDEDVVLVLRPAATLSGRVLQADGQPVARMNIECYEEGTGQQLGWGTCEEDGTFAFQLPAGSRVRLETGTRRWVARDEYERTGREEPVRVVVSSDEGEVVIRLD